MLDSYGQPKLINKFNILPSPDFIILTQKCVEIINTYISQLFFQNSLYLVIFFSDMVYCWLLKATYFLILLVKSNSDKKLTSYFQNHSKKGRQKKRQSGKIDKFFENTSSLIQFYIYYNAFYILFVLAFL